MPDDAMTRGDLEALRSELKGEIATTRLEVAQLRTDMSERFGAIQADMRERFGAVQAELADVRKELAVLQVDIRKDLTMLTQQNDQTHGEVATLRQDMQQMRQDVRQDMLQMRQEMNQWRISTTRQLWTMVSVMSGAVIVGILKAVSQGLVPHLTPHGMVGQAIRPRLANQHLGLHQRPHALFQEKKGLPSVRSIRRCFS